jgi:4-hydroxy-2-oxoheptanedioate aldolase
MRERQNLVQMALAEGRSAIGIGVQTASPETVEMVAVAGYDFAYIDCEHGAFDLGMATQMIRAAEAAGTTPIVRVPDHQPSFIMRILDAGAMGVIVPNVRSRREAESVVAAATFKDGANGGVRGACPGTRATWHQVKDWPSFAKHSNKTAIVWLLIESPEAVDSIGDILDVPGIDALMFGQFDLAHAMGLPGMTSHPDVARSCAKIAQEARRRNVDLVATIFSTTPEAAAAEKQSLAEMGVKILVAGTDRRLIMNMLNEKREALL